MKATPPKKKSGRRLVFRFSGSAKEAEATPRKPVGEEAAARPESGGGGNPPGPGSSWRSAIGRQVAPLPHGAQRPGRAPAGGGGKDGGGGNWNGVGGLALPQAEASAPAWGECETR